MAVMDSRIILAGQPVNSLGALAAGTQLAAQTNAVRDQNNLRDLYQAQGPGILAGDASSLNALAGLDPMAALDVRNVQDQRAERQERLRMARAAGARAAASAAASQSRAERDAQEAEIRRGLGAARTAGSAAEWDAIATQFGADELVGQFDQRDAVISFYEGYTEPSAPSYREFDGNLYTETPNGLDLAMPGQPDAPTYSIMSPEEVAAIPGLDPSRTYQRNANGQITPVGGGGQTINIGGEGAGGPQIGAVPQGWSVVPDPSEPSGFRMYQIGGGPEDTSTEDALNANIRGAGTDLVLDEIGRARDLIENQGIVPNTGPVGAIVGEVLPNTDAGSLGQRLQTIRANIGFDRLQQMRDASPTGGALGQVSEFENRLLQSVYGSLLQAQDDEELLYNLDRLERTYQRIINQGIPDEEARRMLQGGADRDISQLDVTGLLDLNIDDLSDAEIRLYNARMQELLNER